MEERITFDSDGLKLSGVLHTPEGRDPRERRPAFLVLHGFGSNKDSGSSTMTARMLAPWGYVALRFDMRGCGQSEGAPGRVICLEQVEDTKNALTFLANRPGVVPERIGCFGHSFGAAIAIYAAGVDPRIAACISWGGWGEGEKKFRKQHASPEAWRKFTTMLEEGRRHRDRSGESSMVPRFDIVPIPPCRSADGSVPHGGRRSLHVCREQDGVRILTIPRHNPINAITMGVLCEMLG